MRVINNKCIYKKITLITASLFLVFCQPLLAIDKTDEELKNEFKTLRRAKLRNLRTAQAIAKAKKLRAAKFKAYRDIEAEKLTQKKLKAKWKKINAKRLPKLLGKLERIHQKKTKKDEEKFAEIYKLAAEVRGATGVPEYDVAKVPGPRDDVANASVDSKEFVPKRKDDKTELTEVLDRAEIAGFEDDIPGYLKSVAQSGNYREVDTILNSIVRNGLKNYTGAIAEALLAVCAKMPDDVLKNYRNWIQKTGPNWSLDLNQSQALVQGLRVQANLLSVANSLTEYLVHKKGEIHDKGYGPKLADKAGEAYTRNHEDLGSLLVSLLDISRLDIDTLTKLQSSREKIENKHCIADSEPSAEIGTTVNTCNGSGTHPLDLAKVAGNAQHIVTKQNGTRADKKRTGKKK